MATNYENYRSWYADLLPTLFPDRNAGFIILMVAFPLLERYLRQIVGLGPKDNLNEDCMKELCKLFPELPDETASRQFWDVFRNGILHQVTLSRENRKGVLLPLGLLCHNKPVISIDAQGEFWVNPVLFTQRILTAIEGNFGAFEGKSSAGQPLPTVVTHGSSSAPYLGTRGG